MQTVNESIGFEGIRCNCEHEHHMNVTSTCSDAHHLAAQAMFVGSICDTCATSHMTEYLTAAGRYHLTETEHDGRVTAVAISDSHGQTLANMYGPDRTKNARAMLLLLATGTVPLHTLPEQDGPVFAERHPSPSHRCPRCGGSSGQHGFVHVRHGNGGGSNLRCPLAGNPASDSELGR